MNKRNVWTIVILIGSYIMCQAIADVGATKLVSLGSVVIPGGTFIFALTFTIRDMIHKRLGKEWARAAIVSAAGLNIIMALYFAGVARLDFPSFFALGDSWSTIFSIVPAITIASITAEVVSELLDTEVYHVWKTRLPKLPQWSRVVVSNAASLPVDSLVFALLGFVLLPPLFGAEALPVAAIWSIVGGQVAYKAIVTAVSLPLIYTVKDEPISISGGVTATN